MLCRVFHPSTGSSTRLRAPLARRVEQPAPVRIRRDHATTLATPTATADRLLPTTPTSFVTPVGSYRLAQATDRQHRATLGVESLQPGSPRGAVRAASPQPPDKSAQDGRRRSLATCAAAGDFLALAGGRAGVPLGTCGLGRLLGRVAVSVTVRLAPEPTAAPMIRPTKPPIPPPTIAPTGLPVRTPTPTPAAEPSTTPIHAPCRTLVTDGSDRQLPRSLTRSPIRGETW